MSEKNIQNEKTHELYLISHTHWDREWYLPFEQFRIHLVNLIDNLIELLEKDPEYRHFNLDGQTIVVEDYLDIRPENKNRLSKLIKENRIAIGPWYCQPDEWTSGELLVRNLLRGNILSKNYGIRQNIGYCPDLFGHVSQMPQILNLAELDTFMFFRGLGDEYDNPKFSNEFHWIGPDGSDVLAYYMPGGYSNAKNHPPDQMGFNNFMLFAYGRLPKSKTHIYFIGCGGDHYSPQSETPRLMKGFNSDEDVLEELEGGKMHHSTLTEFFKAIRERENSKDPFFKVKGEFRYGRVDVFEPGSISSRIYLKQANGRCWRKLCYIMEPLSVLMQIDSSFKSNEASFLDLAWKNLLQNQPHDSMCGCSIDAVHRDMERRFGHCEEIVDEISSEQLKIILKRQNPALRINTHSESHSKVGVNENQTKELGSSEDDTEYLDNALVNQYINDKDTIPVVIFNPNSYPTSVPIKVRISSDKNYFDKDIVYFPSREFDGNYFVIDSKNRKKKCTIQKIRYMNEQEMLEISWISSDLEGMGYYVYYLVKDENSSVKEAQSENDIVNTIPLKENTYENDWLKISFHDNGSFDATDKKNGISYENLHYLEDQADAGDGYDFYGLPDDTPIKSLKNIAKIRGVKTHYGAIFSVIYDIELPIGLNRERTVRLKESQPLKITSKIEIYDHIPRIDFTTELDNDVKDHRLRAVFPTPIKTNFVSAASIFDVVNRTIGIEGYEETSKKWIQKPVPTSHMNQFVSIHENGKGSISLFNKGLPEYEARRMKSNNKGSQLEVNKVQNNPIELIQTLFRSVPYEGGNIPGRGGAGSPIPTPEGQLQRHLSLEYSIYFHKNNWADDEILRNVNDYILPLGVSGGIIVTPGRNVTQNDDYEKYPQNLGPSKILLKNSNPNIIITSFKPSINSKNIENQRQQEFIVRMYNPLERIEELTLDFGFSIHSVKICNILEDPLPDSQFNGCEVKLKSEKSISIKIPNKKILTIMIA